MMNAAASDALISVNYTYRIRDLIRIHADTNRRHLPSARAGAFKALLTLLPLLGPLDKDILDGSTTELQLTNLFASNDSAMILAVVRALEFVGTGQSVGPIERLIRRKVVRDEVLTEAGRILPILQERKKQEEAPSLLLRASQSP